MIEPPVAVKVAFSSCAEVPLVDLTLEEYEVYSPESAVHQSIAHRGGENTL